MKSLLYSLTLVVLVCAFVVPMNGYSYHRGIYRGYGYGRVIPRVGLYGAPIVPLAYTVPPVYAVPAYVPGPIVTPFIGGVYGRRVFGPRWGYGRGYYGRRYWRR
jgi:hypothetical protein